MENMKPRYISYQRGSPFRSTPADRVGAVGAAPAAGAVRVLARAAVEADGRADTLVHVYTPTNNLISCMWSRL